MGFAIGDRVRIKARRSTYRGRTGVIVDRVASGEWCVVIDGLSGWLAYSDDQIERIAEGQA